MSERRRFPWFRWLFLLGLLGGGGYWLQGYLRETVDKPPEYRTSKISRGDVVQKITATGQLNPVVNVQVGSQISGIITNLHADFNSVVKAGQLLAELDSATFRASLSQAEGNLASARASHLLAEINARRATEMRKNNLIAEADFDKAQADLKQAEASVQISTANVERARVDFARCKIYSPIDGVVISRAIEPGQTVAASLNAPTLFIIANDLTRMQINANISEADIGGIKEGQDVEFTVDAFPGRTFRGQVKQVRYAPIIQQNVVTYDTVIEIRNDDLMLKPGMTANVNVITARRDGVLRVANAALRFRPPAAESGRPRQRLDLWAARFKLDGLLAKWRGEATPAVSAGGPAGAGKGGAAGAKDAPRPPGESPGGGKGFGGDPARKAEMMKRFDKNGDGQIDEEERAAMRAAFGGGGGGGGRPRSEASSATPRTIYVVGGSVGATNIALTDLKAITVKPGITDGVNTEVVSGEGLNDGDLAVTGVSVSSAGAANRPTNPFASGSSFGRGGSSGGSSRGGSR